MRTEDNFDTVCLKDFQTLAYNATFSFTSGFNVAGDFFRLYYLMLYYQ